MKKIIYSLTVCCLLLAGNAFAQKAKLISGDVKILKAEKKLLLQFDYTGLKVGGIDDADYIKNKTDEKNKKEPGSGDKFQKEWVGNREKRFEPKFTELLNKGLDGVKASKTETAAKYTFIVKTDYIEPGFNIGIMRKPAFINVTVSVVETANPTNVLAKILLTQMPGQDVMGFDYDGGMRIAEGYAKAGKELAKYLAKNAYK